MNSSVVVLLLRKLALGLGSWWLLCSSQLFGFVRVARWESLRGVLTQLVDALASAFLTLAASPVEPTDWRQASEIAVSANTNASDGLV